MGRKKELHNIEYKWLYDIMKIKHPRSFTRRFNQFLKKCHTTRANLRNRTIVAQATYTITIEELRELIARALYKPCYYCGDEITLDNLNVDHIIPLSHGGNTEIKNLQCICRRCNTRKGSLNAKEYSLLIQLLKANFVIETYKYIMGKLATRGYASYKGVKTNDSH